MRLQFVIWLLSPSSSMCCTVHVCNGDLGKQFFDGILCLTSNLFSNKPCVPQITWEDYNLFVELRIFHLTSNTCNTLNGIDVFWLFCCYLPWHFFSFVLFCFSNLYTLPHFGDKGRWLCFVGQLPQVMDMTFIVIRFSLLHPKYSHR